ncbi:1-(5-phosphoribosyl)-5-[(5-phosphoribosylamino)methylideneamino] imidazole-4-carboxamide isomerase [Candidatus Micrarchaeota archaeon]|nr:1-(5-phosphoribosyl)-5-[(5-phosphoribosylamino)methylideneamino] imidazole-4-carboxamide isomerase [Candidatus Micrarchaeota archaeon]
MGFEVIPAVDLLNGSVVRLSQGRREDAKEYSVDPVGFAKKIVEQGARRLHVVDLNAAFRQGNNLGLVKQICAIEGALVQVGGGIRAVEYAKGLRDSGADRIFISTIAFDEPKLLEFCKEFGERVWVGCEVSDGSLVIDGWRKKTSGSVSDFLSFVESAKVGGLLVTDVGKDGMNEGIRPEFFSEIRAQTSLPLIAAGGITDLGDARELKKIGFEGAVVGKALYEGVFPLSDALKEFKQENGK